MKRAVVWPPVCGGIAAEHLHLAELQTQAIERDAHRLVVSGAVDIDEEHVFAELALSGSRLDFREVDAAICEFGKDHLKRTGAVVVEVQCERGLHLTLGRKHGCVSRLGDKGEIRLIASVVLDAAVEDAHAGKLRRALVGDGGSARVCCGKAGGICGGLHWSYQDVGEAGCEILAALRERLRVRRDGAYVVCLRIGMHEQAVVDIDDFLAEDDFLGACGEGIEGARDRPLDGVLESNDSVFRAHFIYCVKNPRERRAGKQNRIIDSHAYGKAAGCFVAVRACGA